MNRQEEIKELAKIIHGVEFPNSACWFGCDKCLDNSNCDYLKAGEQICDAGWRKQIEAKWIPVEKLVPDWGANIIHHYECSNCRTLEYTNDRKYCSNCGAKMEK
jgi:hypothetical protein